MTQAWSLKRNRSDQVTVKKPLVWHQRALDCFPNFSPVTLQRGLLDKLHKQSKISMESWIYRNWMNLWKKVRSCLPMDSYSTSRDVAKSLLKNWTAIAEVLIYLFMTLSTWLICFVWDDKCMFTVSASFLWFSSIRFDIDCFTAWRISSSDLTWFCAKKTKNISYGTFSLCCFRQNIYGVEVACHKSRMTFSFHKKSLSTKCSGDCCWKYVCLR